MRRCGHLRAGHARGLPCRLGLRDRARGQGRRARGQPRAAARGVLLEASGGLTLSSARSVAETGVDFLAVGALTHSAPVLDIGADYRREA